MWGRGERCSPLPPPPFQTNLPISSLDELSPYNIARRNFKNSILHRSLSYFRRGFLAIEAAVLNRLPLLQGSFFSEPWPIFTRQLHVFQIALSRTSIH
ncbi:hypothetical protein [Nostoc sp.]|uniref:hypothetical protein n=1 Tax=Nostoc sp. TaxID=1180 RepID=UPI002FF5F5E5